MKSIFTKLSTLLFAGAVALVGCSDFSADLREVNDKLDNLSNEAARKTEVEALKTNVENLVAQLENQYATKKEVAEVSATVTVPGLEKSQATISLSMRLIRRFFMALGAT